MDQKLHLQQQQHKGLNCPRCDSTNTKFCYYNNYSLSQPRHFCKACKRYWTRGGTLRTVPVGGGCRKNKRVRRAPAPQRNGNTRSDQAFMNINDVFPSTSNQVSNYRHHQMISSSAAGGLNRVTPMFFGESDVSGNGLSVAASFDDLVQRQLPVGSVGFSDMNGTSNAALLLSNYSSLFTPSAPSSAAAAALPPMMTSQRTFTFEEMETGNKITLEDTNAQKWNKNSKIMDHHFHHPDPSQYDHLQINQPYDHSSAAYWNVSGNVDLLPHHHHHQSTMDGPSYSSVPSLI